MRLVPLLVAALVLSVGAHVYLALRPASPAAAGGSHAPSSSTPSAVAAAGNTVDSAASGATTTRLAADGAASIPAAGVVLLRSCDPEALKAHFEALGFAPEMVRALVSAAVWRATSPRMMELQRKMWGWDTAASDYWRGSRPGEGTRVSAEERAELRRIQRENQDKITELFGEASDDPGDWQQSQFRWLPGEKRSAVAAIERDYQELRQELQMDMAGFPMASDQEKMKFLQEEQRRDLAALLSPEELQAYDLRHSPSAQQMRWRYADTFQSEEEYSAAFALQKAFDEKWNPQMGLPFGGPGRSDPNAMKERQAAEKAMQDQLASLLGAERAAEIQRAQDREYQQLRGAARRFGLPADAVKSVYKLKDTVAAETQKLAEDTSLTPEQRVAQSAALVERTRTQIRSTLGAEVADAYLANNMRWLDEVAKGSTLRVSPNGSTNLSAPKTPKPATPGATTPKP